MKIKKMEEGINEIMDKHSQYLFNKPYYQLLLSEQLKLDQYIKDLSNPEWKPVIIKGKDTGYKVSNTGQVLKDAGTEAKYYQNKVGWYITVYIKNHNNYGVHRLMALAFLPNPENKPQVNHINGKKDCNWIGNLEWVTAKENAEHAWRIGLVNNRGESQGSSIYTEEQIREVCSLLNKRFSYIDIERITGVSRKAVYSIRASKIWKHISKEYKFSRYKYPKASRKYSDNRIHKVCKLLENPKNSHAYISSKTGVSIDNVKDVARGHQYMRISKEYNIPRRQSFGEYGNRSKYTTNQIKSVCCLLADSDKSIKSISDETGVNIMVVYDVLNKRRWKSVSSDYDFTSRINKSHNKDKSSSTIDHLH